MKKFLACLTVLMICLSLAAPAAAAEFVPSITMKGAPNIVGFLDGEGLEAIGKILDDDGTVIGYVRPECLVVTAVADAKTSKDIPADARDLLLSVYDKLTSGEMTLPYGKHGSEVDELNMVIRDLFDATWLCEEHPEAIAPEGVTFEITFDLGVAPDQKVYVMSYKNEEWNPVVSTVNNGDGTVTCVFESLCPIEFSVEGDPDSSKTGDIGPDLSVWGVTALASLAAIVVLTVVYRKDAMKRA